MNYDAMAIFENKTGNIYYGRKILFMNVINEYYFLFPEIFNYSQDTLHTDL